MAFRRWLLLILCALPAICGEWNPRLAEQYLDGRQKLWVAWPRARESGVACVSCHTSLPYLMARPALRRELGESETTPYEIALLDGMRATLTRGSGPEWFPKLKPGLHAEQIFGTNSVLAALVLALDDAQSWRRLSRESEIALNRMWSSQVRSGAGKGAWLWTAVDLDPWETTDSMYFGAALAAVAAGSAPDDYQSRPAIRENVAALGSYLREAQRTQPLHNRLAALWGSRKLRGILPDEDRAEILAAVRERQSADGGWTVASLGAWKEHAAAPPAGEGSDAYATALAAFQLERGGVERSDRTLERALEWLRRHQNAASGYWDAQSMNKRYEAGSMQIEFMRDAATGYATAALLDAGLR